MKRILVAEDNDLVRDIYKEILSQQDYDAKFVVNGQQALNELKNNSYDLILIDIMMPLLDGLTILTLLKSEASLPPQGPIYVLTNLKDEQLINKCLQAGAKGYLVKSDYDPGQLLNKVNEIINN